MFYFTSAALDAFFTWVAKSALSASSFCLSVFSLNSYALVEREVRKVWEWGVGVRCKSEKWIVYGRKVWEEGIGARCGRMSVSRISRQINVHGQRVARWFLHTNVCTYLRSSNALLASISFSFDFCLITAISSAALLCSATRSDSKDV